MVCIPQVFIHPGKLSAELSSLGFSSITVSIIDRGAGSVGVSALPIFPKTQSCFLKTSTPSSKGIPGKVDGIYKIAPSFNFGINSDGIFLRIKRENMGSKKREKIVQKSSRMPALGMCLLGYLPPR